MTLVNVISRLGLSRCGVYICICVINSPTSDGSACAIVASEDFVHQRGLEAQAVEIVAQSMFTDFPSTFNEKSCMKVVSCIKSTARSV